MTDRAHVRDLAEGTRASLLVQARTKSCGVMHSNIPFERADATYANDKNIRALNQALDHQTITPCTIIAADSTLTTDMRYP